MIRFDGVTKHFGGVRALSDVSFTIARGSTHALVGENGAGKSTLGNLLAGVHRPTAGRIEIDGAPVAFAAPRDALARGIAIVHQELLFCPNLTVADNLCLGDVPHRRGWVDRAAMRTRARERLQAIGVTLDVDRPIGELGTGHRQLVQIAHAVGSGARVIVFDEPTSALSQGECDRLFEHVARLQREGLTLVWVSHRLDEIARLCDTVTVLRDGRHVETGPIAAFPDDRIVELMAGRAVDLDVDVTDDAPSAHDTAARLAVDGLGRDGSFADVTFSIGAGEVVGFAGLVGSGRSEVARVLFGLDRATCGTIRVDGEAVVIRSPRDAMRCGLALLPEDRKHEGLVLEQSVARNTALASLERLARWRVVSLAAERRLAHEMVDALAIRTASVDAPVATLSGGNQQKVALAKWLARDASILVLDEPTRGVDVAAKAEIHRLIARLAAAGKAVLLISSELTEVVASSHRVVVMRDGRIAGTVTRQGPSDRAATQQRVLRLMTGVTTG